MQNSAHLETMANVSREEAWLLHEAFNDIESDAYVAAREQLRNGMPLAYLIGSIPFGPLTIGLASHPLIPRTETEYWVMKVLHDLQLAPTHILDLCAGSGCIGALARHALPHAHVDFAEIEESHHVTIRDNLARNGLVPETSTIYGGDLFEHIPRDARYDLILTNPPYIDPVLDRTEESVRTHEPRTALYGGAGGMEIIARIIAKAPDHLTEQGMLVIEHEPEQCDAIAVLAQHHGFQARHERDQYDIFRYSILTR